VRYRQAPSPPPLPRKRSLSPAGLRKKSLKLRISPRTFQVEAICALPHPVPTHSLAASKCMAHLLTGSDDGYIRDYDIFTALNGKNFLTAPQRHHSGVVEGIMKAGQLRYWWENPTPSSVSGEEDRSISPVYSLEMHSDALWALAGSDVSFRVLTPSVANILLGRSYKSFYCKARAWPCMSYIPCASRSSCIHVTGSRREELF